MSCIKPIRPIISVWLRTFPSANSSPGQDVNPEEDAFDKPISHSPCTRNSPTRRCRLQVRYCDPGPRLPMTVVHIAFETTNTGRICEVKATITPRDTAILTKKHLMSSSCRPHCLYWLPGCQAAPRLSMISLIQRNTLKMSGSLCESSSRRCMFATTEN